MMRFKTWIEGFGVDAENMPEPFQNFHGVQNNKQKLVQSLYDSNAFNFHPEDRPQDFINVNTINNLQTMKPVQGLTSFRSEILYGMQFTTNSNLKSELTAKSNELKDQISNLQRRRVDADKHGTEEVRQIVWSTYQDVVRRLHDTSKLQEILPDMVQKNLKDAGLNNQTNQKWDYSIGKTNPRITATI